MTMYTPSPPSEKARSFYTYTFKAYGSPAFGTDMPHYRVSLSRGFKKALLANEPFVKKGCTLWTPGDAIPTPGSCIDGIPIADYSKLFHCSPGSHQAYPCTTLDLSEWDTANMCVSANMFDGLSNVRTINVGSWDVSALRNGSHMFSGCSALCSLSGVSKWKLDSLTISDYMFEGCLSLGDLDVSLWKTPKLFSAMGMFSRCTNLSQIDIGSWAPVAIGRIREMFYGCSALETVNFRTWDMSRHLCEFASMAFCECHSLHTVKFFQSSLRQSSGRADFTKAFFNCKHLQRVDLSFFRSPIGMDFFVGCFSLEAVKIPVEAVSFYKRELPESVLQYVDI